MLRSHAVVDADVVNPIVNVHVVVMLRDSLIIVVLKRKKKNHVVNHKKYKENKKINVLKRNQNALILLKLQIVTVHWLLIVGVLFKIYLNVNAKKDVSVRLKVIVDVLP